MHLDDATETPAIRILNRFYLVFTIYCLLLLGLGVPFIFARKLVGAASLLFVLAVVLGAWHASRRGHPQRSLLGFSAVLWVIMVALMFAGLSTNGAAVALAIALMLSVVVSQRAGQLYGVSYLLAWLFYIVLGFYQLTPTPYFANVPLTGWIIVAGACWLFLIPIPELIKSMKQGEALQRSVFDATSDALLVVDRTGKIESFNQRFVAMWQLPEAMVASRDKAAIVEFVVTPEDDPAYVKQRVAEIYARPEETSFDTLYLKDGRVIERYSHPNTLGAQVVGRVWSFRDITEQNAREQALEQAIKTAQNASRAKGEFLANMSHEIRTPMNAILGMLQLLGNTPLNANQLDYLGKTEGAAKSLLGLLNDILDLSKIDSGKMHLDLHPFSVESLLSDLAVVLSAHVGNKQVDVLYDIDPALPAQLVGDPMRLQQTLINLGGNAIKFTSKGQVVIAMRRDTSAAETSEGLAVCFSVEDSGIGIAPENHAKIFSEFAQAESSTTRRFGGTGLGLAISKRLIELMGGQIALRSAVGMGSCFSFTLRLALVQPTTASAGPVPVPVQTALVIDDNPRSADVMANMLKSAGWKVDVAHSGQEALDRLGTHGQSVPFPYGVLYIDWQMPHMDGWEFLQLLGDRHPTGVGAGPKIIMLSTNGRENLAQRTHREQGRLSGFLVKPVTLSMLLGAAQGLPAKHDAAQTPARSSKRRLAGMRILVVEDNAINQQVAEGLLGFEGALVSIAADGRQGVNAVASATHQFDAVLMDIQMPVMDGYAATQAIRQELGLTKLPIIGLSANAMASDREACLRAGMNEHVGKPFDTEHLVNLLTQLTERPLEAPPLGLATATLAVSDLDLPAALGRMGGMQSLYVSAARLFQTTLDTLIADLNRRLDGRDLQGAADLLHAWKGNAATLGLNRLSQSLQDLERLCRRPGDMESIGELAATLAPIVQAAQDALNRAVFQLDTPAGAL